MIRDTSSQDVILEKSVLPRDRVKRIVIAGIVILTLILIYRPITDWFSSNRSVDRERVRFAQVTRGDFIRDIALQGNIIAANSPKLYAPTTGTVTLLANPGNSIERGDLVAQIDNPELTNRLQQEQSKLKSLAIELDRKRIQAKQAKIKSRQQIQLEKVVRDAAERELRRAKLSIEIQAISQIDFEQASDDLKRSQLKYDFAVEQADLESENLAFEIQTAEFEYNQYQLLVDNTNRLLASLQITAPVTGVVGSWSVEQKSAVAVNQALLTIVDLSAFQVEIEIPETYAAELKIGMLCQVTYNNQNYPASITTISPEVNNNLVKGRITFNENPPEGLKQNQRVTSKIILEQKSDVLYLPRSAFMQSYGGQKVFVVEQNIATLTNIKLGSSSVDKVEVISGLNEGQEIIISDTDFVETSESLILN